MPLTGSPQPVVPYDPFAADDDAASTVFDVVDFGGATGDGVTDDTTAITNTATALAAAGSGTLHFPRGTYNTMVSGTSLLGSFVDMDGLKITSDGATILVAGDPAHFVMFQFSGCSNVFIDPPEVTGTLSTAAIQSSTPKNGQYLRFQAGNTNVFITQVKVTGIQSPVQFANQNDVTGAYDNLERTKNVTIGSIDATNCFYGLVCHYSPWNADIGVIRTNYIHRSVVAYGIRHVNLRVDSRNHYANDIALAAGRSGGDITDLRLDYKSGADSTVSTNSAHKVWIGHNYSTTEGGAGGIFRNIEVNLDVTFPGSGTANTGASALQFDKVIAETGNADIVDRGHRIENFKITGHVENYPSYIGYYPIGTNTNAKWGTGDFWRNILIENLRINNSTTTLAIRLGLNQLVDSLVLRNVNSTATIELVKDTYTGSTDNAVIPFYKYKLQGVTCPNLYVVSGSANPISVGAQGGVIARQSTTVSTTAVITEETLFTTTIPAATLVADGQWLRVSFFVSFAANANTKTVRGYFGATALTFNSITTAPNAVRMFAEMNIFRTGAATQFMTRQAVVDGGGVGGLVQNVSRATPAETLANAIVLKITGQNAVATAGDINLEHVQVEFIP